MAKILKADVERSLLDMWMPPDGAGQPVAAIATTYEFDPRLWELQLLPRFLRMETDVLEQLDPFWVERETRLRECYASVLVDASNASPNTASPSWDQIAVYVKGGILHSKIALLQWRHCVRLVVGSANLTDAGYRVNHEIFYVLDFRNDTDSHPRKLLLSFISALETIATHTPPGWEALVRDPARRRLLAALAGCKSRVSAWRNMPHQYRPRAPVKLAPIVIEPGPTGSRRDLFSQLAQAWGNRKADWLSVMSPFWDAPDTAASNSPTKMLAQYLRRKSNSPAKTLAQYLRRNTTAYFVCSGEWIRCGVSARVNMPESVIEALRTKLGDKSRVSPVIRDKAGDLESGRRALHAKSLLLYDSYSQSHVFYGGSSNFTKRGTGLVAGYFEAGIALIRRNDFGYDLDVLCPGTASKYELPLEKVQFAKHLERNDDEPSQFAVYPPFALVAEYDAARKQLAVTAMMGKAMLPSHRVGIQYQGGAFERWLEYSAGKPSPYPCAKALERIPTALALDWSERRGVWRRILFPVCARDRKDLPQPEALRDIALDDLLDFLASARPPWKFRRNPKSGDGGGPSLQDSLKLVDTSGHFTTQVRRFGKAVAGLRRRLAEYPSVSVDGLRSRFYGPFGPWSLLRAICRTAGANVEVGTRVQVVWPPADPPAQACSLAAFLAVELALALKWVPFKAIYEGPRYSEAKREWQKLVRQVGHVAGQVAQAKDVGESLKAYTRLVMQQEM